MVTMKRASVPARTTRLADSSTRIDEGLHVRRGDVAQQRDRRIRRGQGSQCEPGTVGAVVVLLGEVAVDEHGEEAVSSRRCHAETLGRVGDTQGPFGLQDLGEP